MTELPNDKKFMREKIVRPKETRSQKAGRFFCPGKGSGRKYRQA